MRESTASQSPCERRIIDGDGVAYFVEGIGPPLQQIAQDYRTQLPKSQATHDVLALIDHIERLQTKTNDLRAALEWVEQTALDPPAGTRKGKLRYIAVEARAALERA